MRKKLLFFSVSFVLLLIFSTGISSVPNSKSNSDTTGDVLYYEYNGNTGYSTTNLDNPSVDIEALSYQYSEGFIEFDYSFVDTPEVNRSYYYYTSLMMQTANENGTTFSITVLYSNFAGASSDTDADDNETIALVSNFGSGPSYEINEIVTHIDGNSVTWTVDLTNHTGIFGTDTYEILTFTGIAGQELNADQENTDYYYDEVNQYSDTSNSDSEDTDNTEDFDVFFDTTFAVSSIATLVVAKRFKN